MPDRAAPDRPGAADRTGQGGSAGGGGGPTVVLFTRDLRVRDHPALAAACRWSREVVPLFVLDDAILRGRFAAPNRAAFLVEALADLRASLESRGGSLVLRSGDPVEEALRVVRDTGATRLVTSADVTAYARRRERRLADACATADVEFALFPGVTVVPPGELRPASGDHYKVFTPYWRAWERAERRAVEPAPRRVRLPVGLDPGRLPERDALVDGPTSPRLPEGGETAGRARLDAYVRQSARGRPDRDDLAADETTRLSPYLHFGCLSALTVAERLRGRADDVVRQIAWRDFHHQVTAAFPGIATRDYRPGRRTWTGKTEAEDAIRAWQDGRTGVPLVDAGMRQLLAEGWMHNRARMVVASFLTKSLGVDWRVGAAHFFRWLVDGDVANNAGNWQWVAGTGNDTRPNRVLNPVRQGHRFDPDGRYVRRWVPELAGVEGGAVHEPWKLPESVRATLDYPPPLVDPVPRRA